MVPVVAADAIFATFVVACSESISSANPPAGRSESMNTPRPALDDTSSAVVPVAPPALL